MPFSSQSAGVYVAGFIDPGVRGSEQMYDLFLDGKKETILHELQPGMYCMAHPYGHVHIHGEKYQGHTSARVILGVAARPLYRDCVHQTNTSVFIQ
jgi:hypothetical protein